MRMLVLAMVGGALGAGSRYLVGLAGTRLLPVGFPWATLGINVAGSFAMGLVVMLLTARLGGSEGWRVFLATGILGGFTTFSAFALDVATLLDRGAAAPALGYIGASVMLSILGLYAGLALGRAWL